MIAKPMRSPASGAMAMGRKLMSVSARPGTTNWSKKCELARSRSMVIVTTGNGNGEML